MPISYRILKGRGIVYVRYWDAALMSEGMECFARYAADPDARPTDRHLVDLSAVTSFDNDWTKLMAFMAQKTDQFSHSPAEVLLAYYAPTAVGQRLARMAVRAWEVVPMVAARVLENESEALEFLGVKDGSIATLLARAGADSEAGSDGAGQ